ncbi:VOC family protein [Halobacteriaceae archaeon GCM10025711]
MDPRISVVTLGTDNLQRATRFYRDVLDLPMQEGDDGISFFETAGCWLALYPWEDLADDACVEPDRERSGFRGFTLAHNVGSREAVDALLEEVEAGGASVVCPPEEKEWGGYSGYFADPDGFLWEVAWNPQFDLPD